MVAAGSVDETPAMKAPETRYTLSGDVNIAYQVIGQGPLDLVFIPSLTHHVELVWENPPQAQFFGRLASVSRLADLRPPRPVILLRGLAATAGLPGAISGGFSCGICAG
jgi:hypothetical protein